MQCYGIAIESIQEIKISAIKSNKMESERFVAKNKQFLDYRLATKSMIKR
jgi:hypothetical protein